MCFLGRWVETEFLLQSNPSAAREAMKPRGSGLVFAEIAVALGWQDDPAVTSIDKGTKWGNHKISSINGDSIKSSQVQGRFWLQVTEIWLAQTL